MKLQTIAIAQLSIVTGGAAVTADNFMPRAYALQALNNENEKSPSPKLAAQMHTEFCGSLYPYAKSGAPINGAIGRSAVVRWRVTSEGANICK
jgi:hypothetical protein